MDHHNMNQQQEQQHAAARSVSPEPEQERMSMSSYPPVTATFRSQRITSPLQQQQQQCFSPAAPPQLLQPPTFTNNNNNSSISGSTGSFPMNQKLPPSRSSLDNSNDNSLPLTMAHKKEAIGTIPVVPSYHMLERTAMRIPESSLTVGVLLDRILDYLRLNSVSYDCQANTGCLDCMASHDGDMVGLAIQVWRDSNDNSNNNNNSNTTTSGEKMLIVEAQRREGCSIAMNAIRRGLMRHIKGEVPPQQPQQQQLGPTSLLGRRSHHEVSSSYYTTTTTNHPATFDATTRNMHKRPRSLSPDRARLNCQDALSLGLRLLSSPRQDQNKLGLESLTVMTNPRVVDPTDAHIVSRALVLGDGPFGGPLQSSMAALLQTVHPKNGRGTFERNGILYHLALHVLANALQVAEGNPISLSCSLWQIVMDCLLFSLDDASQRPHEAALSAKCIRHLLPATQRAVVVAAASQQQLQGLVNVGNMQATVERAHQFGKSHHKSLEHESQRLLGVCRATTAA